VAWLEHNDFQISSAIRTIHAALDQGINLIVPCRCNSLSSCTSLPLNKSRNLLRLEWPPVYHVKGCGIFNRHYGDFCTGADTKSGFAKKVRQSMVRVLLGGVGLSLVTFLASPF
jgi:hypothetical protein